MSRLGRFLRRRSLYVERHGRRPAAAFDDPVLRSLRGGGIHVRTRDCRARCPERDRRRLSNSRTRTYHQRYFAIDTEDRNRIHVYQIRRIAISILRCASAVSCPKVVGLLTYRLFTLAT